MAEKDIVQMPSEHQVGNTKYIVAPVYGESPKAESLEDKIRRMILSDKERKAADA